MSDPPGVTVEELRLLTDAELEAVLVLAEEQRLGPITENAVAQYVYRARAATPTDPLTRAAD